MTADNIRQAICQTFEQIQDAPAGEVRAALTEHLLELLKIERARICMVGAGQIVWNDSK